MCIRDRASAPLRSPSNRCSTSLFEVSRMTGISLMLLSVSYTHLSGNQQNFSKAIDETEKPQVGLRILNHWDNLDGKMCIRDSSNISDIPVILLTSKSEVEHRLEGLRRGADAFLRCV